MATKGKRYTKAAEGIDSEKFYTITDAMDLAAKGGGAKFDESVEMAIRLGVDPRHADQNVRGVVALPHGTGRDVRVAVFAKGEKAAEAEAAGADIVGGEELVTKIREENFFEFDRAVATPDMMGQVGRIGKMLGPRGLMPNPKTGTVTLDVAKVVKELKAGQVEFRVEKAGIVHVVVGKVSFGASKLVENANALVGALLKAKPSSAKGNYIRSAAITTTMGPGISLDTAELRGV
jgi:large subunit ribosomal protein L1